MSQVINGTCADFVHSDAIERTMTELGGIFSQLAEMVSQQGEQM